MKNYSIKSDAIRICITEDILTIINRVEEIQESNESQYTKEQAKITAYDDIVYTIKSWTSLKGK